MAGALIGIVCLLTATLPARTPQAPPTLAEHVTVSFQRLRATIVFDLPAADPNARFNVVVSVKAGGQTIPAVSFSGDVGPIVTPGPGKRITWAAGRDIETPQFDLYDISVIATPAVGSLRIETSPPGATVTIDTEAAPRPGTTPLSIPDLTPGAHRVTVSLAGYVENSNMETVDPGVVKMVSRTLTSLTSQPGGGAAAPAPKGGLPKWVLPAAGGGGAAAILALRGKKTTTTTNNPGPCAFAIQPTSFANPTQAGGTAQVTVSVTPTGCSPSTWTASDGDLGTGQKMTVSATAGSGSQTITVTLPPNNTVSSRNATATIAGQAFTMTGQPG